MTLLIKRFCFGANGRAVYSRDLLKFTLKGLIVLHETNWMVLVGVNELWLSAIFGRV